MGPLEKYKQYSNIIMHKLSYVDHFPWKLLIHLILILLSSAQVIMIMEYTGDYSRRAEVHWLHTFLDDKVW